MIESNFAYDYINNIPWDDNPTFAFSGDTNAYIKAFESVIDANVLPIGDMKISFEDDYWDFNPYLKDTNTKDNRFSFEEIKDSSVKNYCKFYVLYEIMGRKKISTINVRFTDFKSLYLNIIRNTNHNSLWLITNEDIINNINSRGVSPSTAHNLYEAAYQFYNFFIKNYKLKLPVDLKELKELGIKEKNLAKQNIEVTKIPNIPEEYFIKILNKCLELMRNKDMDYSTRVTAAMIVILSQTGLRTGDLLSLKIDNLFKKRLTKSGNTTHYIQYTAKKPSKAHAPLLQFEIFLIRLQQKPSICLSN